MWWSLQSDACWDAIFRVARVHPSHCTQCMAKSHWTAGYYDKKPSTTQCLQFQCTLPAKEVQVFPNLFQQVFEVWESMLLIRFVNRNHDVWNWNLTGKPRQQSQLAKVGNGGNGNFHGDFSKTWSNCKWCQTWSRWMQWLVSRWFFSSL